MNVSGLKSLTILKSHCPEIQLGQKICRVVNEEFPHYSITKFKPLISRHIAKTSNPAAIHKISGIMYSNRPQMYINGAQYLSDLFPFVEKYKSFNCYESANLSELALKINGVKNSYTANLYKGDANVDHVVCLFNRDGSPFNGEIKNNQTIIIDAWAGVCDFANKLFKEYEGYWAEFLKIPSWHADAAKQKFELRDISDLSLKDKFLEFILERYPNLKL